MVKRCVRIYIEGGGRGRANDSDFRQGWKTFLKELHQLAMANGFNSLEVVRGLGRARTFDSFKNYKKKYPNDLCVLLVDAEMSVPDGSRVWDIVRRRKGDEWLCPAWATESHLYLMVPFVETWLVTDPDALLKFFQQGFKPEVLPKTDLENQPIKTIEDALKQATRYTLKRSYRHGQAHEIIGMVDPKKVKTLHHGQRLFTTLGELIKRPI